MIRIGHIAAVLCAVIFLLLPGCQRKDRQSRPAETGDEIVCPMLYQESESFVNALKFIEVPEERMETSLSSVRNRGEPASQSQLLFANKLFSLRKSGNVDMFVSMLSEGTKKQLNNDNNKRMLHHYIREIKDKTFLYGEHDFKFFATFREFTQEDGEILKKHASFSDTPSDIIQYFHFHKPKYMLIGSSFYLMEDNGSYRIVTQTLLHGELAAPAKNQMASGRKESGIVSFEQIDDAYTKTNIWKYDWEINLGPDQSRNNTFELLKLTEIISAQDHADIHPEIAEQVLLEKNVFEKYRYKQFEFRFRIGDQGPVDNLFKYGQRLSGWDYSISIGGLGTSSSMFFPGIDIANVRLNKQGGFDGSDLEFISFETTKEGIRYKNRVILRKEQVSSKDELERLQPQEEN